MEVDKAISEVLEKSDEDIERETALVWAARAVACYVLYVRTGEGQWLIRADRFKQEAVEHAALALDGGQTVAAVEGEINQQMRQARSS